MVGAAAEMRFEEAAVYKKRIEALAAYQEQIGSRQQHADQPGRLLAGRRRRCGLLQFHADRRRAVVNSFTVELKPGLEDRPQDIDLRDQPDRRTTAGRTVVARSDRPCCRRRNYSKGNVHRAAAHATKLHLLELSGATAACTGSKNSSRSKSKDPERHTNRILAAPAKRAPPERPAAASNASQLEPTGNQSGGFVRRIPRRKTGAQGVPPFQHQDRRWSQRLRLDGRGDRTRYRRLLDEDAELPQLIVVDGGRGSSASPTKACCGSGSPTGSPSSDWPNGSKRSISRTTPPLTISTRNSEALKSADDAHTRRKRTVSASPSTAKRSLAFIKKRTGKASPTLGNRSVEKLLQRFRTLSRIGRLPKPNYRN